MKTPLRVVIFCLAFCLLFGSCKKQAKLSIGFFLPHMTINRYPVEKETFTSKIQELGGDVIFMSANNDEFKQIEQVKEILDKGIDVLVLDPVNRFTAALIVREAHSKGVKVISYDRLIANCDVDFFITFNASSIGDQMAKYALDKRPEGKYFILGGDKSDLNAVLIDEAITKFLTPLTMSGKINVVYKTFIEKYSADDAEFEVNRFLRLSGNYPDVILASSDKLAFGAVNALKKFDIAANKIVITGQDCDVFGCKNILNGYQSMSIYKPVKKMAAIAAELSMKIAKGQNITDNFKSALFNGEVDVPALLLEVITVDSGNLKDIIIPDGLISEADLAR